MSHPFDRYAEFTDVDTLKEFTAQPLRKCIRVNTLLTSVQDVEQWGEPKGWQLEPIPWTNEGFFIDREDRSVALGKDLLHLLGHIYFQEASSMLPVELLDPQPGENVLDMSAAPGSKTTQIAGKMNGEGVIVANDLVDGRLKTLKAALARSGVTNVIITKKMGQWFGKHMTGRFDRVLCDAPCTGQGTARKDPEALKYCSEESIAKNAKLQRQLLEAAVHACKIGGRIVYSTCTLTPEENEMVVYSVLEKFTTQLEVVNPTKLVIGNGQWVMDPHIDSSVKVQECMSKTQNYQLPITNYPFLRLWPQTENTEGFFCAVLEKTGPTMEAERFELRPRRETVLLGTKQKAIKQYLTARYGAELVHTDEEIFERDKHLYLANRSCEKCKLPTGNFAMGLPFGRRLKDDPVYIDHEFTVLRGHLATQNVCEVDEAQLDDLLHGKDTTCDPTLLGHVIVQHKGKTIGRCKARDGKLKNNLPRWMVYHSR